ncbi:MAG: hypothetical protein C0461_11605 [Brevundimonas sp.]|nr:hypothetical protein [Brevundimonas sp.]
MFLMGNVLPTTSSHCLKIDISAHRCGIAHNQKIEITEQASYLKPFRIQLFVEKIVPRTIPVSVDASRAGQAIGEKLIQEIVLTKELTLIMSNGGFDITE